MSLLAIMSDSLMNEKRQARKQAYLRACAGKHHEEMECIAFENHDMGIYFITDPDGYWLEIIPEKR